jgi:hypothetical protein
LLKITSTQYHQVIACKMFAEQNFIIYHKHNL